MIARFDPVQILSMGGRTLGTMESDDEGDWVSYKDYLDLRSDMQAALCWIEEKVDVPDHQESLDLIVNPFRAKHDLLTYI